MLQASGERADEVRHRWAQPVSHGRVSPVLCGQLTPNSCFSYRRRASRVGCKDEYYPPDGSTGVSHEPRSGMQCLLGGGGAGGWGGRSLVRNPDACSPASSNVDSGSLATQQRLGGILELGRRPTRVALLWDPVVEPRRDVDSGPRPSGSGCRCPVLQRGFRPGGMPWLRRALGRFSSIVSHMQMRIL